MQSSFQPLSPQGLFYNKLELTNNNEIENAFSIILNEINKRDERIKELEEQVTSLKRQLLVKNNQYQPVTVGQTNLVPSTQESPFRNINQDFLSNRINYNSDSEKKVKVPLPWPTTQTPSNSFMMTNSGNKDSAQSRNEVKNYLKEVKDIVDPKLFKECIKNIKLLTNKTANVNKKAIIENVRNLFGEQYIDLYMKFETILGVKK